MATTETYSFAGDFSGSLDNSRLTSTIQNDDTVTTACTGVTKKGAAVLIGFVGTLSVAEKTQLDALVGAHVPDPVPTWTSLKPMYQRSNRTKSGTYDTLASYIYDGSYKSAPIINCRASLYRETDATSFSVRLYDRTSRLVLAELTGLTNSVEMVIELGTITNVPTEMGILQFQVKRLGNGGGRRWIHADAVSLCF